MKKTLRENIEDFKEHLIKIEYLSSASSVLYWDMRTGIPKKGVPYRSEVLGYLASEAYKLQTDDIVKEYADYFNGIKELDDVTKAMVENALKEYHRVRKIPEKKYREFVVLQSKSEAAWEEAKEKSDFETFILYLEKIVEMTREFVGYWGHEGHPYNTLLDFYEPGVTVEKLDILFDELKTAIVDLLGKIKASGTSPATDFFQGKFSKEKQEKFGVHILKKIGYDFEAGRLAESVHPFTSGLGAGDVRITTHYIEEDMRSAVFSCIHEGGHGIYDQNIPEELLGTGLKDGASMGIHESQSRFYENILGRSKAFWTYFYPELKNIFPSFSGVSLQEFYKGINVVEPSLIRTEADELTYSLHIIIRYEIEKLLISGEVTVQELPALWNKKYKEYLGVEPKNNAEGVLQDVHWADGSFGYFPSYTLGNLYGAQFFSKMKKDIPDLEDKIEKGKFIVVKDWLGNHIHRHGKVYKPEELIKRVTGEELSAKYFIEYLNEKYSEVYAFSL